MLSIPQLLSGLRAFDPAGDARAVRSRESTLALLDQGPRALSRDNFSPGHLTASAIVLSPDRSAVLLVFHQKLGRWLQPGGHMEPSDASSEGAAVRELLEETGVSADVRHEAQIVGIDVHQIPAWKHEPAHLHHDVVWRVHLPAGAIQLTGGAEWCAVTELGSRGADPALHSAVARAMADG